MQPRNRKPVSFTLPAYIVDILRQEMADSGETMSRIIEEAVVDKLEIDRRSRISRIHKERDEETLKRKGKTLSIKEMEEEANKKVAIEY